MEVDWNQSVTGVFLRSLLSCESFFQTIFTAPVQGSAVLVAPSWQPIWEIIRFALQESFLIEMSHPKLNLYFQERDGYVSFIF